MESDQSTKLTASEVAQIWTAYENSRRYQKNTVFLIKYHFIHP
jgi:hypothetical protein